MYINLLIISAMICISCHSNITLFLTSHQLKDVGFVWKNTDRSKNSGNWKKLVTSTGIKSYYVFDYYTSVSDKHVSMLSVQLCYSVSCHRRFQGKQLAKNLLYRFYCFAHYCWLNFVILYVKFRLFLGNGFPKPFSIFRL